MKPPYSRGDGLDGRRPAAPDAAKPKRAQRPGIPGAGLQESRIAAERARERTAKLRQLRLERDAAEPAARPAPARRPAKSDLNLARTQRTRKT